MSESCAAVASAVHVQEREARLAMDEKNLLHPIDKAAQHDDLGKAAPGAKSLETPLQALPGKTLLQRLIERLQEPCARFRRSIA